jgi:alkaline phosphatase/alkaline phosphatase D
VAVVVLTLLSCGGEPLPPVTHAQGEIAGEVTASSVILQSRLTTGGNPDHDESLTADVPGEPGVARFELSTDPDFAESWFTGWLQAVPEHDFIVKTRVDGLEPATRHYYRLVFGRTQSDVEVGPRRSFKTLAGGEIAEPVRFAVVTCMNYAPFHLMYQGEDRQLGYPALVTLREMAPEFIVFTGDNVYYDGPSMKSSIPAEYRRPAATTEPELRRKWHQQLVQPRFAELFTDVATYWQKDDHDYRFNDCDNTTPDEPPSPELGRRIFREQVPVVDPADPDSKTYRTHRINRLVQIWLTEGRDFRSPHMMEDGPGKSLWGVEQRAWLQRTLLSSDAPFKLLINANPMIGPDDSHKKGPSNPGHDELKRDNHSNPGGFQYERNEFFEWLGEHGLIGARFFLFHGDRHWQYHSISPEGVEEFSCGALHDENSRLGRSPGDPDSNDPEALITQPYTQDEKSGGFIIVSVDPGPEAGAPMMTVTWFDEHGVEQYSITRTAT